MPVCVHTKTKNKKTLITNNNNIKIHLYYKEINTCLKNKLYYIQ